MALFVYITEECRIEAQKHSIADMLTTFAERVEKSQNTTYFDPFPPPYLVKKKFGIYQGRLIASEHFIQVGDEEHTVIVFLAILIRGSKDYENGFADDAVSYGNTHFTKRFSVSDLKADVTARLRENPPAVKQDLSDSEAAYLCSSAVYRSLSNEDLVCESRTWVEKICQDPYKGSLPRIFDAISDLLTKSATEREQTAAVPNKQNWRIHACHFPELKLWLLLDITRDAEAPISSNIEGGDEMRESVLRATFRTYPQYILADEDMWMQLECDSLGNFALSTEETKILESTCQDNPFPLFINGRAGSGKSTILQYVFTDYLFRYLSYTDIGHPPVYFTSNGELLLQARKLVKSLLRCNTCFSESSEHRDDLHNDAKLDALFDQSFMEFRKFLLSRVPQTVRYENFAQDKYIGFTRFRRLWSDRFSHAGKSASRDYGPDISWHVIRTFIKGTSVDNVLEIDDYESLEEKQRTVTSQTFKTIYDKVWTSWYEGLSQEGFWDDQDLVRYVLEKDLLDPAFPGIFCDESQDFTRIELEAFLRMSLFSNRSVSPQLIARIPFVFAGDEFQTLNPTGFRWDAVKAWFTEKFILALNPGEKKHELNFCVLKNNYRSSSSIVRFCNFIQLLRAARFGLTGVEPQHEWDESQSVPVVNFDSNDPVFWEGIKRRADTVFIVPCHEGEELDFIRQDEILSKHIQIDEKRGTPSVPVLSAAMAKGLEYPCVIAYGFGNSCEQRMIDGLMSRNDLEDTAQRLPLEYFLNRVYVATSRPRRQLFILDTQDGMRKLWRFAKDTAVEQKILGMVKMRNAPALWKPHICHITDGTAAHMQPNVKFNLEETAGQLENVGRASKSPYMLRQAGNLYRDAKREEKATRCDAEAYEFEGEYGKAAQEFTKIPDFPAVLGCRWLQKNDGWGEIVKLADHRPDLATRLEALFARALTNPDTSIGVSAIKELGDRVKTGNTETANDLLTHQLVWGNALNHLLDKLLALSRAFPVPLLPHLMRLREIGIPLKPASIAQVAFNEADYKLAVELWETANETKSTSYYHAKAKTTPYPESLNYCAYSHDWKSMISFFEAAPDITISGDKYALLVRAYLSSGRRDEAWSILPKVQVRRDYADFATDKTSIVPQEWVKNLDIAAKVSSIQQGDLKGVWHLFISLSRRPEIDPVLVARALARMALRNTFPVNAPSDQPNLRTITDYLRFHFIEGKIPPGAEAEIGGAFEQAGSHKDGLQYYERVLGKGIAFMERWIVCKEKFAAHQREVGDMRRYEESIREAAIERAKIGIPSNRQMPEFPTFPSWLEVYEAVFTRDAPNIDAPVEIAPDPVIQQQPLPQPSVTVEENPVPVTGRSAPEKPATTHTDKVEFILSGFRFRFHRTTARLNIERETDGMVWSVVDQGSRITGDQPAINDPTEEGFLSIPESEFLFKLSTTPGEDFSLKIRNSGISLTFSPSKA
jgi:tetratricopeptide (TPR) repeat protein